jgi:hypothetical protein
MKSMHLICRLSLPCWQPATPGGLPWGFGIISEGDLLRRSENRTEHERPWWRSVSWLLYLQLRKRPCGADTDRLHLSVLRLGPYRKDCVTSPASFSKVRRSTTLVRPRRGLPHLSHTCAPPYSDCTRDARPGQADLAATSHHFVGDILIGINANAAKAGYRDTQMEAC